MEKLQNVTLPPGVQATLGPLTNAVGEVFRYVIDAPPDMPLDRGARAPGLGPPTRAAPRARRCRRGQFRRPVKEYQVRVDPFLLRKYGVTIDEVAQASPGTAPTPAVACSGAATRRW